MGNVNKLMMSPPGYSGALRKGHLIFDACFESGECSSPVYPIHQIPVIELVLYMLTWCWQHNVSLFRCTYTAVSVILLYIVYHQTLCGDQVQAALSSLISLSVMNLFI